MNNLNYLKRAIFDIILLSLLLTLSIFTMSCSNNSIKNEVKSAETESIKSSISGSNKQNDERDGFDQSRNAQGERPNGGMGGPDKSGDEVLQGLIETEIPKFQQFSYTDEQSNITIEYNLYIPKNYDPNKKYPMVQFIPDASAFGKGTLFALKQGYGGLVWTTDEAQSKNECFVYVPAFNQGLKNDYPTLNVRMSSVVDDDYNVSEDVFVNIDCIKDICKKYSIDTDRIYTTGQSMGGILSFFYAAFFNDVFAAYMPVGSQFDNSIVQYLPDIHIGNAKIIYIVSEGDTKAGEGMTDLMNILDWDDSRYSFREFSVKETYENQNKIINEAIAEGKNLNLFMFNEGEVVPEGIKSNNEHMYSFDYAYKIDAAREYLFKNKKGAVNQNPNSIYLRDGAKTLDKKEEDYASKAEYENALLSAYILLLRATLLNDKKAPRYIGYMYENGLGVNQSDIQASIFYHIGAMRGDITSNYYLGLMYLDGRGVAKNVDRAKYYLSIATNSGNDDATGVKEAKLKLSEIE